MDQTLAAYASQLGPSSYDRAEVSRRRAGVEVPLRGCSLRVSSMFESGSNNHGTGVKAHSDVDLMAVATGTKPMLPSSALAAAKLALSRPGLGIFDVSMSSPVVKVGFLTAPAFEIAPCWWKEKIGAFNVYWIGGRGDEWVESAPQAHLAYVNRQNDRLHKRVKPLVRLLKAWKYEVGAPVSSFYLEMRAAEYAATQSVIVYDIDLRTVMDLIVQYNARDMNDPEGIVGRIPACSSEENRRKTLRLLNDAVLHLRNADAARERGDRMGYWSEMVSVFGYDYPLPAA